ncbi:immunoglobulin-like domain-containing protein [Paenibacillus sp. BC26]|uniref:immunoglobulin-like domain-containing protein n=1 Tax=Paenibacillus sp. BC26 TaxID=1881032 RepID=UPI0015A6F4EC|nr:immunoglobulin-like domain-containing protein [Paenibacillus sp. BC26]
MRGKVSKFVIMFICFMLVFGVFFQQKSFVSAASSGALTSAIPNEPITGAAYGNGVYVAAGYYGKILTSANGLDWQIAADKTRLDVTYTGVTFGDNVFVAVGYDGTIMTSPDGAVWTQRDSTVTGTIARVAYVSGINKFFAVTKAGVLLTSTNGVTWTSASVGTSKDLTSIAASGSTIVIGDSGGYVHTSTNGTSWTHKKLDNSFFINSVLGLNGRFYANDALGTTHTSTDGINWASAVIAGQVFGGLYDGSKYYLFGYDGTSYGAVFTSDKANGVSFSKQGIQTTTMTAQNGFYANGVYMQLGNDGIVVSTDGTAWNYAYGGVVSSVLYNGTEYIAVGKHGNDGFIKTSADFVNWTPVTLPQRVPALTSIATGLGKYVVVSDSPGTVLTSTNGTAWNVNAPAVSEYGLTAVAFANAVFVAVDEIGSIYKLANGSTSWTLERSDSVDYNALRFVAFDGSGFYAAGDSGVLLQSDYTGSNWQNVQAAPIVFTFDKKSSNQTDVPITFTGTFRNISVSNYSSALVEGTDYSVSGTTVTVKKSFLAKLPLGWQTIALHVSNGPFKRAAVNVVNTASSLAQVSGVQLNPNGNASWGSVAGAVSYEAQLYRNGSVWGSAVSVAAGSTSTNFLAAMLAAGAGNYTVKVKAIGDTVNVKDGAQSAASGAVTIYKAPAEDGTANKEGTTQRADFTIIVTAQNGTKATAKVGGVNVLQTGSEVPVSSGKATLPIKIDSLSEGENAIVIVLQDPSGNINSQELSVKVTKDTTAPITATEDGTADKAGTTQTANFNIVVNAETGAAVTAKVGGTNVLQTGVSVLAAGGKATLPIDLTKLTEGANNIAIVVTDPVGNVSDALTVSVTKDTISAANAALAITYGSGDSAASVTQSVTLPTTGMNGTTVSWSSSVPATIGATGVVTRPAYGSGNAAVTLTATISVSGISQTKTFELTVLEQAPTDAQAVDAAKTVLDVGYGGGDTAASVTQSVTLPNSGLLGTTVTWSSDHAAVIGATGAVTRPIYGAGDATVTLTATITRGAVTQTKTFILTVQKLAQTDVEAVSEAKSALEVGYGGTDTSASVTEAVTLSPTGLSGTTVTWSSDDVAVNATTGAVTRPAYGAGDATVTLTATITKNAASETKTFTLTVLELAQTDEQAVDAAKSALEVGYSGGDTAASVTQAVTLPGTAQNGVTVTWSSDDTAIHAATGAVTRPAYASGDATVTLTATIKKNAVSETKTFTLTVTKLAQTDAEAVSADKLALEVGYGNGDTATGVTQAVTLPATGLNGTTVTWSSDDAAIHATTGAVTRPEYGSGDLTVTLTATIKKNAASETKTFTLTVLELAQTDAQAVDAAKSALEVGYSVGDTAASVTQAVTLPGTGLNGVTVTWSSDDAAVHATTGAVTRPAYGAGDATVTLTATIKKNAAVETKMFTLTVTKLAQTDAEAVSADKLTLEVGYGGGDTATNVTQAVTLPATGLNGTTVTWSSNDVAIHATTGAVTRPAYGLGDANVTLTATIKKNAAVETKTFTLTVTKLAQTDAEAVSADKLTLEVGYGGTDSVTSVTQAVTLPATGLNGTTVTWSSDDTAIDAVTGAVTRPAYGAGDTTVTLTATIKKNAVIETKTFTMTVTKLAQTDAEAVSADKLALEVGYGGTDSDTSVTQAVTLPATGLNGTIVTWLSDNAAIDAVTGAVTRPAYGLGDATVTLTATIKKNAAIETKTFTLTVLELAQTDAQAVSAAKSLLAITYGGSESATSVTQAVTLPAIGLNGVTVTWSSDNAAIDAAAGAVTRPAYGAGDATVTLTATIKKNAAIETKTFTLTVPQLAQTDAQAVSAAKSALAITYGGSDTATSVTQALTLPATGLNGVTVTWSSDNTAIDAATGAVTRPAYGAGDVTVTLTATIKKNAASETKTFTLTVPQLAQTDAQAVTAAKSVLAITYGGSDTAASVTQAVTLPTTGLNGVTVTWTSDDVTINATTGAVTRPAFGAGNATVTLTATITKGAASETKTFTLAVIELDEVIPPDVTPPAAPAVNAVDSDDLVITGTAEAGSTITVKAGGTTVGSAVAIGGTFSITLTAALPAATELEVTATDAASNVSPATLITVTEATVVTPPDVTPPAAPTVNAVDSDDLVITGTAEAGSTVTVKAGGTTLGSAVATGGTFSITLTAALPTATELEVTATDAASNVSSATLITVTEATVVTPPDVTPPAAPAVNAVDSDDLVITGTAEAGSTVTVKAGGTTLGSAVATGGTFSITLTAALPAATQLEVTATDAASNVSTATLITVTAASTGTPTTPSTPSDTTVTSTDGTLTLPAGQSGKVSFEDAVTISIPAGSTTKDLKLTIDKVLNTQHLVSDEDVLASPVFEILKNFSENFSKSITLTFAFDPTKLSGDQKVAVYYYDEVKKEWVKVGGVQINQNHISVEVNHFTKYAVFVEGKSSPETEPTIHFSDIAGHWAEANIKKAVSSGIVKGYQDGTFKPGKTVTRAEFAVMLMNVLKPQGEGAQLTFMDTAKIGTWAQKAVAQAVQAGIITGYADGSFGPNEEITRAEMAAMIAKATGTPVKEVAATDFADDKDIPAWAKAGVAFVKQAGIVQGKGDNQFAPRDHATRAEAVTVLLNLLA